MAAPKTKNPTERERLRAEIAALDHRGYSQEQIGAKLGMAKPTVNHHLKKIRARYRETQLEETRGSIYCKLLQYRELRREAWDAWERSKEDGVRTITERTAPLRIGKEAETVDGKGRKRPRKNAKPAPGTADDLRTTRVATVVEGRLPATEYLKIIADCLKAERELLGLDAPKKTQVMVQTLDWAALVEIAEATDSVEDRIEAALEKAKMGMPGGLIIHQENGDNGDGLDHDGLNGLANGD